MRSRAHIKSHPLHPILIPFPIVFFAQTVVLHIAGWIWDKPQLLSAAYYTNIAGVIMAVVAAVPGVIDYINVVPPKSSAKKRGAKHGLANTTMLLLFLAAFIYRRNEDSNHYILLALELAGTGLMLFAGWLGGTLVYRNQIGVDVRYGNSGKWNEAYFTEESGTIEVAGNDELKVNAMKLLHLGKKRIVLARTDNGYTAFDDRCPHKGASLAGGSMMCGTVQCPWHGSQFSVSNGAVTAGPSKESIRTYAAIEKEGKIFITV